jgi:hypothetical protein
MAPRNKPSSIDRLPEPVQEAIAGLRRQGRTIDEILEHLQALDVEVSRSALGRHVKSLAVIGDQMRRSETMAKFIAKEFGAEPDERVGRANMAILQGALLELLTAEREDEDGQPVGLSIGEAKELSLALQRLTSAQRVDADRQLAMRAEFAKSAATAAERVARTQGITGATVEMIKNAILGVGPS